MSDWEGFCPFLVVIFLIVSGIWLGSRLSFLEVADACHREGKVRAVSVLYSRPIEIECKVKGQK